MPVWIARSGRACFDSRPATLRVLQFGVRSNERLNLGLDHLMQDPRNSLMLHFEQQIDLHVRPWARQSNDSILVDGMASCDDLEHHRGCTICHLIHQIRSWRRPGRAIPMAIDHGDARWTPE